MTAPSLEERIRPVLTRLRLALLIADDEIESPHMDAGEIFRGLVQLLDDTIEEVEALAQVPFPLSEYRDEPIAEWLKKHAAAVTAAAQATP